jgi:hypothetical protein
VHDKTGVPEPLPERLIDWDPMQNLSIKRTVVVETQRFMKECGLGRDGEVSLVVSWRSPGSGQRGAAFRQDIEGTADEYVCNLDVHIPGVDLAGSVLIMTRVLLKKGGVKDDPLAASRPGSILWEDSVSLQLEGLGSRFPMEVVDFGLIGLPKNASWRLQWPRDNLQAQAMGCMCLLLNKAHKRVLSAVVKNPPDPEARAIWSAINVGVAREIIVGALGDEAFMAKDIEFKDGSVGQIAIDLIERAFPSRGKQAALECLKATPDHFECEIQAGFQLFNTSD